MSKEEEKRDGGRTSSRAKPQTPFSRPIVRQAPKARPAPVSMFSAYGTLSAFGVCVGAFAGNW
jgi:hypothetical protein